MREVNFIYIDMNSYFASVEQQENPSLRGKPVGIVTIAKRNAACIAASYEAKALGIGVGTRMHDARKICPQISFCAARHDIYVNYHHRIKEAIDLVYPVEGIHSVDEYSCRLLGKARELDSALEICTKIRDSIYKHVGIAMRCSIGLGTSQLLAKLAGELHKPEGLDWLTPDVMPQKISHLRLKDIPGIGKSMERNLHDAKIHTIAQLYQMQPKHARKVWNSVNGERFLLSLQGKDIPQALTHSHSLGHGQILATVNRVPDNARLVARRLLIKAATRLRRSNCFTASIYVSVKCAKKGRGSLQWKLAHTQDTFTLLALFEKMWIQLNPLTPLSVSVTLGNLKDQYQFTSDLFDARERPGQTTTREKLCSTIDMLNQCHGQDTIIYGQKPVSIAPYTGAKIAFGRIPTKEEFRD